MRPILEIRKDIENLEFKISGGETFNREVIELLAELCSHVQMLETVRDSPMDQIRP